MALKIKAVERLLKFDKESTGKYRYVMKAYWIQKTLAGLHNQTRENFLFKPFYVMITTFTKGMHH